VDTGSEVVLVAGSVAAATLVVIAPPTEAGTAPPHGIALGILRLIPPLELENLRPPWTAAPSWVKAS
jgi:hypothetical protein